MKQEDRYIRFDWAIKRLLRQKANFGVLEGLLTVLLDEKIEIVELLESESNQQAIDDKFNRVDIKAKDSKGDIIIVEIQNTREVYYLERILYGVAKAITEHISLGNNYSEVKKIYSLSILYFDIGKGSDYLYHGQNHFIGVHTGDRLEVTTKQKDAIIRKLPAEIFPEYYLIRVNEFNQVAVTPLEEWIDYLKTGCIRSDTKAPGLEEARQKLIYYNMPTADRQAYDRYLEAVMIQNDVLGNAKDEGFAEGHSEGHSEGLAEGLAEGHSEGLAEGLEKGRKEGEKLKQLEVARRLKALNIPIEIIVESTNLSSDEINQL